MGYVDDPLSALAGITTRGWLVGGALRDRLLGRTTNDFDVVLQESPEPVARALGQMADGHAFALSEAFGAWRVVSRTQDWQVDLLPLDGEAIEHDLRRRDFTVNAMAERLGARELVDPCAGLEDLRLRRLRMVGADAFEQDPLRTLRLARLSCELGFAIDSATRRAAPASVSGLRRVAPERIFAELKRIVAADAAVEGLALMDAIGATGIVLPELSELRGVEQSRYHHLDVHEHTRAVLAETIALQRDPETTLGEHAEAVACLLAEPLADELTRGQALRFGALFHDIAKPRTRAVTPEGRVTFIGHDEEGAGLAAAMLTRLRASQKLSQHVAELARHHLRLGFLVHQAPLSRRAIYRYLSACVPVQVDVTVLSVADRLATRGSGSEEAIRKHLALARQLIGEAFAWLADPPRPPLRGDELCALGITPGPELGRILKQLEEDSFAGELRTREQALQRVKELLPDDGSVGSAE
jgi:putative nucleotidyltransferase with HDIG domain